MPIVHSAPRPPKEHKCPKPELWRNISIHIGSIWQCDECQRYWWVVKSNSIDKKKWVTGSARKTMKVLRAAGIEVNND